jgi:hypothetical protein
VVNALNCNELEIVPAGNPVGSTYDAVVAIDADTDQLEVPKNPVLAVTDPNTFCEPVMVKPLPVISNDPVITALPENGNPVPVLLLPKNEPENEPL